MKRGTFRAPFYFSAQSRKATADLTGNRDATGEPVRCLLTSHQMARPKPRKKVKIGARKASGKSPRTAVRPSPELVIITGMSGSGKASVLKAFEDLGYYCVDNLPVELIPRFAELVGQSSEIRRTALVVDVREGTQLEGLPAIVNSVKRMVPTKVIFLERTWRGVCFLRKWSFSQFSTLSQRPRRSLPQNFCYRFSS